MNSLKDRQDYIDRYRSSEISEADFKQRLESDPELKQEFDLYQKDLQIIRSVAKQELRKKALAALKDHEKKSLSIFSIKRVMQIAAVFAVVAAAFFLLQDRQAKSGSELFASHFVLPDPAGERNATPQSVAWNDAMTAYSNQDFEQTIEWLAPLVELDSFLYPDRGKLFLALSQLMTDQNQKAIAVFASISPESSYIQDAEWYQALAFLKIDDVAGAKKALQKIVNQPRHFKQKEAMEISESLELVW